MSRTSRVLAAVVAATALTLTGAHSADAKPDRTKGAPSEKASARGGTGASTRLERDVARTVAQLERTVSGQRLRRVDPVHAATVVANVDADQAALEALVAPAPAGTTTAEAAPVTDLRATLKKYRVENYRLAVNILRQAAQAGDTTEAETVAVDASVALALAITATSSKADVKAARAAFDDAADLLPDEADEHDEHDGDDAADAADEGDAA